MKTYLAAAAILLASAGAAFSQSVPAEPCADEEFSVTTGSCSNEPGLGLDANGPGTIDNSNTMAIEQPTTPQGVAPLIVPNDPLGNNIMNNQFGSGPVPNPEIGGSTSIGGVTSPLIQSP